MPDPPPRHKGYAKSLLDLTPREPFAQAGGIGNPSREFTVAWRDDGSGARFHYNDGESYFWPTEAILRQLAYRQIVRR